MITTCTHCGAQYQLSEKMLGQKARCKACGQTFIMVPPEAENDPPQSPRSPPQVPSVEHDDADDLDALANAATGVTSAPTRSSGRSATHGEAIEDTRRARRKMAKGAQASMAMGIAAFLFAIAGLACMLRAMGRSDDQKTMVTLGIATLSLLAIGAAGAMISIVNGTNANRTIKRARHPLTGRPQAMLGIVIGGLALGLIFACTITIGVFLAKRGGIQFEKTIIQSASVWRPIEIDLPQTCSPCRA